MTVMTFDTHKVVKRLREAGFTDTQAETVTDVLRDTREADLSQLVTKEFLRSEMIQLEQRLVIKLGSMGVVAVGVVAALVKLL